MSFLCHFVELVTQNSFHYTLTLLIWISYRIFSYTVYDVCACVCVCVCEWMWKNKIKFGSIAVFWLLFFSSDMCISFELYQKCAAHTWEVQKPFAWHMLIFWNHDKYVRACFCALSRYNKWTLKRYTTLYWLNGVVQTGIIIFNFGCSVDDVDDDDECTCVCVFT